MKFTTWPEKIVVKKKTKNRNRKKNPKKPKQANKGKILMNCWQVDSTQSILYNKYVD